MEVKTLLKPTKNLIRTADSYSTRSMTDKEINPSPEGADLNLQRFTPFYISNADFLYFFYTKI